MRRKYTHAPRAQGNEASRRDLPVSPHDDLALESTSSQTLRGLRAGGGSSQGWNPYDTIPKTGSGTGVHRLDDIRRLSEWIRMKRELERAAPDNPDKD